MAAEALCESELCLDSDCVKQEKEIKMESFDDYKIIKCDINGGHVEILPEKVYITSDHYKTCLDASLEENSLQGTEICLEDKAVKQEYEIKIEDPDFSECGEFICDINDGSFTEDVVHEEYHNYNSTDARNDSVKHISNHGRSNPVLSDAIQATKRMGRTSKSTFGRPNQLMTLGNSILGDDSDSDIDSEDSCIADEDDHIMPSDGYDSNSDGNISNEDALTHTINRNIKHRYCADISPTHIIQQDDDRSPQESNLQEFGNTNLGCFHGKKKCFTWNKSHTSVSQSAPRNAVKICSSLEGPARDLGNAPTPVQVWQLLFTPNMSEEIIIHTNAKLSQMRQKLKNVPSSVYKDMDKEELDALLAIILFCSIFKSSRETLKSLFSTSVTGRPLFRGIMSEKRCDILFRTLRFDDSATRTARTAGDKAACISGIFNEFIFNSQNNYSLGNDCTIDETLVSFRGTVGFKVYMPNRAAKYGVKIMCLTDARNTYLYDAYIYTGKESHGATLSPEEKKSFSIPTQSVIRLTSRIAGTNRNVTCDKWFTSVQLAEELLKRRLTMVGILKRNKPEIPLEFQPSPQRAVGTTLYGYTSEMTLLSHVTKKNKAVIFLSTMHHAPHTDYRYQKPEIVSFYNHSKCGVDSLDQKCSSYSANRRTRRWSLAVFYHMIAACSSNTFTLYEHFPDAKAKTRFQFVHDVAMDLAKAHVLKRLQIANLPSQLMKTIEEMLGIETPVRVEVKSDLLAKRKLCRYCPYQKNRVTRYKCIKCEAPTCGEHSKKLCNTCSQDL